MYVKEKYMRQMQLWTNRGVATCNYFTCSSFHRLVFAKFWINPFDVDSAENVVFSVHTTINDDSLKRKMRMRMAYGILNATSLFKRALTFNLKCCGRGLYAMHYSWPCEGCKYRSLEVKNWHSSATVVCCWVSAERGLSLTLSCTHWLIIKF